MSKPLINKARIFVSEYYNSSLAYHNIVHAEGVMTAATELGKLEELSKSDVDNIKLACLFHDTGYSENSADHEARSAKLANQFLTEEGLGSDDIAVVERLILATQMSAVPKDILEMVIKDADMAHLGSEGFEVTSENLRLEKNKLSETEISIEDWQACNVSFLENHIYYTSSARKKYNKQKKQNLNNLAKSSGYELKYEKKNSPDRGIETMFRVALRNNIGLSQIADNKANIMLSVTTIMLSIILSALMPRVLDNYYLLVPTILTIVVCLITMYFAVMATRPKVSKSNFSREKLLNNKTNLLFFGNFHDIPLEEYEWGMDTMMQDEKLLYGALKRDLYFLGLVLSKKYKYLRTCYNVFMIGLVLSSLSFILALIS